MHAKSTFARPFPVYALRVTTLAVMMTLSACGSGNDDDDDEEVSPGGDYVIPAAPAGLGYADTAPLPSGVQYYVDTAVTNVRGDACHATIETNAGVRVLQGFLKVWEPSTRRVDAGGSADAKNGCTGFEASDWSGIPSDPTDGKVTNAAVHAENIAFSARTTQNRTAAQELAAYLDDRRGKNYSVTDGMGPLTDYWRTAAQQTSTFAGATSIPMESYVTKQDDSGNNTGVGGAANPSFGTVISFVQSMGADASTEPGKRFYKYARPWRWSTDVIIAPSLQTAKSSSPGTDGGYPSGHTAEAVRNAIAMAYVVPERFQEMIARSMELGYNRIMAGMHSPLDVTGGRILGTASAVANIYNSDSGVRQAAFTQAHETLQAAVGAATVEDFYQFAHSQDVSEDRFADHAANASTYRYRLTWDFERNSDADSEAVVPKGAEIVLETRQPYLTADQRRVVLKTTALPAGYPVLDDEEGYGRLNLFAAADGYAAFNGDVTVTMDASQGGFNAMDSWRNDITGAGKLTKEGTGTLALTGANEYSGGTEIAEGTLRADSKSALGAGAVYVDGGTLEVSADDAVLVKASYTQLSNGTLSVNLGNDNAGQLTVSGVAALAGALHIQFADDYTPVVGQTLTVLTAQGLHGQFDSVSVDGYKATVTYGNGTVQIHLDSEA